MSEPIKEKTKKEQEQEEKQKEEEKKVELRPTPADICRCYQWFDKPSVEKYWPIIAKEMAKAGMLHKNNVIGVVATIAAETTTFKPILETMSSTAYSYYGGPDYRGRGFVQLTHDENYKVYGEAIGQDLLANPDLAMEPEIAAKLLVAYFSNAAGQGYDIRPYAEKGDFDNVRSIVNAGSPGLIGKTTASGTEKFNIVVQNALEAIKDDIPAEIAEGELTLPPDYGSGDIPSGGAGANSNIMMSGSQAMGTLLQTAYALYARQHAKTHYANFFFDAGADPMVLKLEPQKTFKIKNLGKDLDGKWTVEEVTLLPLDKSCRAYVKAYRPDPNAKPPFAFRSDTNAPMQKASPSSYQPEKGEVRLAVPYMTQLDSAYSPHGSCNATSMAMAMAFLGHKSSGSLKDELYGILSSRGTPGGIENMRSLFVEYGFQDNFVQEPSVDNIKGWLQGNNPAVIHGVFTNAGHIVCVIGFNSKGFIVHDPYGQFLGNKGAYDTSASGENNIHDYTSIVPNFWMPDGTVWIHYISK